MFLFCPSLLSHVYMSAPGISSLFISLYPSVCCSPSLLSFPQLVFFFPSTLSCRGMCQVLAWVAHFHMEVFRRWYRTYVARANWLETQQRSHCVISGSESSGTAVQGRRKDKDRYNLVKEGKRVKKEWARCVLCWAQCVCAGCGFKEPGRKAALLLDCAILTLLLWTLTDWFGALTEIGQDLLTC